MKTKTKIFNKNKITALKAASIVAPELINSNRFGDILNILAPKCAELKKSDRYLYAYALLNNHQPLKALAQLCGLATHDKTLLEDCNIIAAHVFNADEVQFSGLSEDELSNLVLTAKSLPLKPQVYFNIKKYLFELLLNKKNYERLEKLIKLNKNLDGDTMVFVENIGKLTFLQADKKLAGNCSLALGQIFVSIGLLILKNSNYYSDIKKIITEFSSEIKNKYANLLASNNRLSIPSESFNALVDYEANVFCAVLELAINQGFTSILIPTPSYANNYEQYANSNEYKEFMVWLTSCEPKLAVYYNLDIHQLIMYALGINRSTHSKNALKLAKSLKLDPYIRLAIMLRASYESKTQVESIVERLEFIDAITNKLFRSKALVMQIICQVKPEFLLDNCEFFSTIIKFHIVLNCLEVNALLGQWIISRLEFEYTNLEDLNFNIIDLVAKICYEDCSIDLIKLINEYIQAQKASKELSQVIKNEKAEKKLINAIKTYDDYTWHLTLVANTCVSLYDKALDSDLFYHIEKLAENKRLNKIIPLNTFIKCNFTCDCNKCCNNLFRQDIMVLAKDYNLPIIDLNKIKQHMPQMENKPARKPIVFSENPFDVIGVSIEDSKPIIMQKIMQVIAKNPSQMGRIRNAQSELFNLQRRAVHHYVWHLNYGITNEEFDGVQKNNENNAINKYLEYPLSSIKFRYEYIK